MRFARTIRFDASDDNVFERAAMSDEWAVSGAFEFSNWTEADIAGKRRQAFANGWLGLESFGRATIVAVAEATQAEIEAATLALAAHFVARYGAPALEAALPVAREEVAHMQAMCEDHELNDLLVVERRLSEAGVHEAFRSIRPGDASIDMVAKHVDGDDHGWR
ncbi:DUF6505 family protein [Rubrimonas cliftonensis]|uniref:Uncharacterized protein n=1 Tax=Rubrimonas cliftonensis TaxID=89524 RepID=A0A1H3XEY2_9RHOB|nr:DUF6505 family protein [Rubrimonas cliftonensis]SDZ97790.1 hypothetical protein SAMN05444370_102390 [Rubrimonas cliftonensis]